MEVKIERNTMKMLKNPPFKYDLIFSEWSEGLIKKLLFKEGSVSMEKLSELKKMASCDLKDVIKESEQKHGIYQIKIVDFITFKEKPQINSRNGRRLLQKKERSECLKGDKTELFIAYNRKLRKTFVDVITNKTDKKVIDKVKKLILENGKDKEIFLNFEEKDTANLVGSHFLKDENMKKKLRIFNDDHENAKVNKDFDKLLRAAKERLRVNHSEAGKKKGKENNVDDMMCFPYRSDLMDYLTDFID